MNGAARYEIEHVSRYRYTAPVRQCLMRLCLEPCEDRRQRRLHFEIETRPPACLNREKDCHGNTRHVLDVHRTHRVFEITARSTVESMPHPRLPERLDAGAWKAIRSLAGSFAAWDFMHPSPLIRPSPALAAFVERHGIEPGSDPLDSLRQLSDILHRRLHYIPGSTSVESPVNDLLETDQGVCQDYAHAMIAVARSWGIPARYVSGYLHVTADSAGQVPDNATHAWVECRLPELGWIGFDPHQPEPRRQRIRTHRGRARLPGRVSDPRSHPGRRRLPSRGRSTGARLPERGRVHAGWAGPARRDNLRQRRKD